MFKNAAFLLLFFAIVNAGYLGAPLGYHAPVVAAPIAVKALPVATSYQNSVHISSASLPVLVKAAPAVHYPAIPAVVKSPLLASPLAYSYH